MDLKGKVALVLRYEPQERDDGSPFDGRRPSRWSALRYKVLQARERGAVAVIFTTGPLQKDEQDRLPVLRNDGPQSPAGIPVLQVRTAVAERWLAGTGLDLGAFQKSVDRDLRPRSRESTGVRVDGAVRVEPAFAQAENVAAILPGRGKLADQVIVLGAHYDHLGYGGEGSMKPNMKADPQRRRRQRVGNGGRPARRGAAEDAARVRAEPSHDPLRALRRRGGRPGGLGVLRRAPAGPDQEGRVDDQPGHGRAAARRPAHRVRDAVRRGVGRT